MMILKRSLLALLLISCLWDLSAQRKPSAEQVEELFWGTTDPASSEMDIPEKWEGESAVVLYQEYIYRFENSGKKVNQIEGLRRRIKLQDKASIEQYSEFSYKEKFEVKSLWTRRKGEVFTGFKVVKPNGEEKKIDLSTAVAIDGEDDDQKKIAIPGLESGDIIDYYFYSFLPSTFQYIHYFDPVFAPLNGEYPIKKQRINFDVEKSFLVSFNSYHGAPELEKTKEGKGKLIRYSLTDENREKIGGARWFYPYKVLPTIKFQVAFGLGKMEMRALTKYLKKGEKIKRKISEYELYEAYSDNFTTYDVKNKALNAHLERKGLSIEKDKRKTLEEVFNYFRTKEQVYPSELEALDEVGAVKSQDRVNINNQKNYFVLTRDFAKYLRTNKIAFHLLAGVPRHYGSIDEILFYQEIFILLYIPELELYVSPLNQHATFSSYPDFMEGTEVYNITRYAPGREKHVIAVSSDEDNSSIQKLEVELGNDFNSLNVKRSNSSWGHQKIEDQARYLLLSDYLQEDYASANKSEYLDKVKMKKTALDQARIKYEANQKELKEAQKERLKAQLENDLDMEVEDEYSYKITSNGRATYAAPFSYEESFSLSNELIQKAGPNLIIEIGRFIGGQVALEKEEMEREKDVYFDYARSFYNEISFSIPEGYRVVGLEKLAYNIDNETGGFVSSAEVVGDKLYIKSRKFYKHHFVEAEKWPLMVEFLEAAYKFSQEKILLKKAS